MDRVEHWLIPMGPLWVIVVVAVAVASLSAMTLGALPSAEALGTPPGSGVSHDHTDCADHGGFDALGTFGSAAAHDIGVNYPGSNLRAGATSWMFPNAKTGSTTGGNNNSLCGGGHVPAPFAGP
jgi:hypothetical protein